MSSFLAVRRVAAVLLLAALAPFGLVADCAGWSPSQAERMACCQREGADCASVSPDDCCSDQEQRQNQEKPVTCVAFGATQLAVLPAVIPTTVPRILAAVLSADRQTPYLLDSVLRI